MTIEQVCLLVVLNLLVGTFIAQPGKFRITVSASLILIAMILVGFALIWRSLTI